MRRPCQPLEQPLAGPGQRLDDVAVQQLGQEEGAAAKRQAAYFLESIIKYRIVADNPVIAGEADIHEDAQDRSLADLNGEFIQLDHIDDRLVDDIAKDVSIQLDIIGKLRQMGIAPVA